MVLFQGLVKGSFSEQFEANAIEYFWIEKPRNKATTKHILSLQAKSGSQAGNSAKPIEGKFITLQAKFQKAHMNEQVQRKPEWLKIKHPKGTIFTEVKRIVQINHNCTPFAPAGNAPIWANAGQQEQQL
jgi:hypothetical protein